MVVDLSGAKEFGGGSGGEGTGSVRGACTLSALAGDPEEPIEFVLNSIRNDPRKLKNDF